ncbi:MAG TPA: T9SS type A sorting domain-containing protein, partial [bacterium]|nr:T9SS type A sorting domain-containing protein [bacterium]
GEYSVTVTDPNGCQATCRKQLSASPGPVCTISGPELTCVGSTVRWCGPQGAGYTYLWHGPEQDNSTDSCITISTAGTYTLTVTDAGGCHSTCEKSLANYNLPDCSIVGAGECCPNHPVKWCAPDVPGWTYLWHGPEQNNATTPCIIVSTPGEYTVTVTDADGCQATCRRQLEASPGPTCTISGPEATCAGGTVRWCGPQGAGYTYLWHGPEQDNSADSCITISTAGTYTLTVTDASGCEATCSKTLTTSDKPKCTITGKCAVPNTLCLDCPPCPGTVVTWCGPDVPGYTYLWSGPEQNGATTRCITIGTAGTYTLQVTDANGCQSRCSSTLSFAPAPECNLIAPDPLPECTSRGNTLTAVTTGSVSGYSWSLAGSGWVITAGWHSRTVTYTAGNNGSTGRFTLIVSNTSGCKDTCTVAFGCRERERNCTYTQGGWGAGCPCSQKNNPASTNPGCVRDHFFTSVFPHGVMIGGTPHWAKWTTAKAVENFLPNTKSPGVLTANLTNPTSTPAGVLAAQILSLRLNREFSCAGVFYQLGLASSITCYGDFVIPSSTACGTKFAGLTVDQFLTLADRVVAGNTSALTPYGASLSDLNRAATCLNEMFDGCDPYATCNMPPVSSNGEGSINEDSTTVAMGMASPVGQDMSGLPVAFGVSQIYPNPLKVGTTITYALPTNGRITIEVYDVRGSRVTTLVDQSEAAGYHSIYWDGTNAQGRTTPSGVYFCRARFADDSNVTRKMIKLQ